MRFFILLLFVTLLLITDGDGKTRHPTYFAGPRPRTGTRYVVGGTPTDVRASPWQAAVYIGSGTSQRFLCGASIIGPRALLSAAHCFYDEEMQLVDDTLFRFVVGKTDLTKNTSETQQVSAKKIRIHHGYNPHLYGYDIAVVELSKSLVFGPNVKVIKLADTEPKEGQMCYVTGFGKTKARSGDSSPILMKAPLPVYSRQQCINEYKISTVKITKDMLCAGYDHGGKAACNGDSGGPLACESANKQWLLTGVVSFGLEECASNEAPGVFGNVAYFKSWIDMILQLTTMGLPRKESVYAARSRYFG